MSKQDSKKENKKEKLTEAEKCEQYLDGWRRAAAELENYKKQDLQRSAEVSKAIKKNILRDMLPVFDGLHRAAEENTGDKEGVAMIIDQFTKILSSHGIQRFLPEIGQEFNPCFHEAVSEIEGEPNLVDKVVDIVSAGYTLEEKIIRPAKVIVGKAKEN